jgi:16S rRNA (guanine527-N7)-methyltransferase
MSVMVARAQQGELEKRLEDGIADLGLGLGRGARAQLLQHLALLEKWNRVYNLTSVRDAAKAVSVHLLDSLAVVAYLDAKHLLDAGSGAGFPGIPIAVARPEMQVDLLDGNHKKCAFLTQAVAELKLKNVRVSCERVESWRPGRQFDCIISRALAEIAELVALTAHLLAPGGVLAAMKGVYPFEEIERIPAGFRVRQAHTLAVPGLDAERHLILIERS